MQCFEQLLVCQTEGEYRCFLEAGVYCMTELVVKVTMSIHGVILKSDISDKRLEEIRCEIIIVNSFSILMRCRRSCQVLNIVVRVTTISFKILGRYVYSSRTIWWFTCGVGNVVDSISSVCFLI